MTVLVVDVEVDNIIPLRDNGGNSEDAEDIGDD
jgi:hypothetical protein